MIVWLHGVGGDSGCWRRQVERFGGRAWDMPALEPMTFEALAAALADWMGEYSDGSGADLVGHSMGGMLALELAARRPELVRRLVLVGTSAVFGSADGSFQRRFLAERLGRLDEGRTMAELAPGLVRAMLGRDPDPAGVALAERSMAAMAAAQYRRLLHCLATFDRRDVLAKLAVPVLVLAGEHDPNAPPQGMERMAARIPGARYVCLPRAGHLINLEQPDDFDRALEDFLAGGAGR